MIDPYLQAEYDNSAKIAGSDTLLATLPGLAAAFRAQHPHAEYGLRYGPSPRQVLDVFWPSADPSAPLVLFMHGGYWQHSDRSAWSHVAAGLLAHGIGVIMPSYDLCPAVTMTALVANVRSVVPMLYARYGRPMLAIGHSAGGHLAATLLATDWTAHGLPANAIHAAMPISGLFDLPPICRTHQNDALHMDETEARTLSPMFLPAPGKPITAMVGGDEGAEYTRQSRELAANWGGHWESLPGLHHFNVVGELTSPSARLTQVAVGLVK